ncbi:MAG: hypothetical protein ACI4AH_08160 [Muribaculaceae bacterium]
MKDLFSISRFWLLLKKDFTENYRLFSIGALSMLFGLTTIMVLFSPVMIKPELDGPLGFSISSVPFAYIYAIGCCISASLMFSPMRTKQGRISLFTLPATSFEKYLEQFLVFVIGFTVVYFACVEVAELLRCLLAPLFWNLLGNHDAALYGKYINHFCSLRVFDAADKLIFSNIGISGNVLLLAVFLGFVVDVAIFTLGAVLWPKYSFIKTYAASYVIGIVAGFVGIIAVIINPFRCCVVEHCLSTLLYAVVAIQTVVAVALFVASYILFKRKNVIHPTLF